MPKPSWEEPTNPAFFGYLKFLDFQASYGLDIHATFQKNQQVHVSVYELGGKKKGGGSLWMEKAPYGLSLNFMDWYTLAMMLVGGNGSLPTVKGYKDYQEFFYAEVNQKAVELGIIAQKPGLVANTIAKPAYSLSDPGDFPGL